MKKKILLDLDDTIVKDRYVDLLNEFLGTEYTENDFTGYYVEEKLNDKEKDDFHVFLNSHPDFYANGVLIEHAIETIEKLKEQYEIFICSAFYDKFDPIHSGKILSSKFQYILRTLPMIDPEHIYFGSNKKLFDVEIRIDDKVKNLKGPGEIKILLTQRHNIEFDSSYLEQYNITRVNDWYEIEKMLLEGGN